MQSLATVSRRMLASTVFEDEEALAFDERVSVVRLPTTGLAGTTLVDAAVRSETGYGRGRRQGRGPIVEFDPAEFTFATDDEVVVAGTDEAVARFERQFSS